MKRNFNPYFARPAFTLVELLVVIAIIGILVGMLFPALQNMREVARRNQCQRNLVSVSLAMSSYSLRHGHYPAGSVNPSGPVKSEPKGYHHNWIAALLPAMDAEVVAKRIDTSVPVYDPANDEVRRLAIPSLRCPSASNVREYTSSFAGVVSSTETPIDEDTDGAFRLNAPVTKADLTDGLAHTLFVGEHLVGFNHDLGWMSGTRSTLRNVGHAINAERDKIREPGIRKIDPLYVGGFSSDHPAGVHFVTGAGEVRFFSTSADLKLLQQLANRSDGELPMDWKTNEPLVTQLPKDTNSKTSAKPGESETDAEATDETKGEIADDGETDES